MIGNYWEGIQYEKDKDGKWIGSVRVGSFDRYVLDGKLEEVLSALNRELDFKTGVPYERPYAIITEHKKGNICFCQKRRSVVFSRFTVQVCYEGESERPFATIWGYYEATPEEVVLLEKQAQEVTGETPEGII